MATLRTWLGPLGRYRPWLFRQDLARGFRTCDTWAPPAWVRWRGWSSPEERLLDSLDLANKVVYDVGAHTGAYSLYFSRRVGAGGQVVAFEPQALSFSKLTRNLRDNAIANVLPICLALGAADGTRPIYMLPRMFTTASLAPEARTPFRRRAGSTRVERLDGVIAARALPPPHFIKIDVEGLELEVLAGAAVTLARYRPCLVLEIHGANRHLKAAQAGR
ncbi:MAG: FkbM family methyltransferase, partial [Streptosporangiaceae bacterium]